jgi:hypothetical protein
MLLPPPPEEMQGMRLEVEYVSILAQAQKAIGVNSISRVIGFIGGVTPIKPDAIDVIDVDEAIREIAILEGIPAKLIAEKQVIAKIRADRQQALQTQQNLAAAETLSKSAKNAADAKTTEPSLMTGMMDMAKR